MTANEPKLKRCPFCGKRKDLYLHEDHTILYKCVRCLCGTMGPDRTTEAAAITTWNTRPKRKKKKSISDVPLLTLAQVTALMQVARDIAAFDNAVVDAANAIKENKP